MMMRRMLLPLLAAVALSGCKSGTSEKRYPMQGEVKGLDSATKTATIDAGKIGDWMEPMTMDYPVKPDSEFQKLHVGDRIQATVVVNEPSYYVTDIKIVPK